jgi:hypothetical protein
MTAEPATTAPATPAPAPPALRVIANRAGLVAALSAAAAVIPTRTYKPLLQCVRLTAGADGLACEATNLEQWVRHGQSHRPSRAGRLTLRPGRGPVGRLPGVDRRHAHTGNR